MVMLFEAKLRLREEVLSTEWFHIFLHLQRSPLQLSPPKFLFSPLQTSS
jgi:hypothetical protein